MILLVIFSLSSTNTFSQHLYELKGTIKYRDSAIVDASIRIRETKQETKSNAEGQFNFRLKTGAYTLVISAVGYHNLQKTISLKQDEQFSFELNESTKNLDEITVRGDRNDRNLASPQMGIERLSATMVKNIPAIFGEKDIIKAIQLLPGIKSAGEGSAGIYVRGGAADQNLVLMDDVPVYNASHLLGFFSSFNPDAVEDITVYKTGMPAAYGGRLSSVLAVQMREGNKEKFNVTGGIGLISSKLTLEGPIQKDKLSFLIAARRTYVDALLRLSSDTSINRNVLYFYDINANINYDLNKKNKLLLTGYLGSDKLGMAKTFGLSWGNKIWSAQWRHLFNNTLSSSTVLSHTDYQTSVDVNTGINNIKIVSKLKDWNFKHQFIWQISDKHLLKAGYNMLYNTVSPGKISATANSSFNSFNYQERFSLDNAFFVNDDWNINDNINLSLGMRLSIFSVLGGSTYHIVDDSGTIVGSTTYPKNSMVKNYPGIEPRIALSYLLNEKNSIKASYVRNSQNMHLISNTTSDRPTDKWIPSSLMVKPEISDQIALGFYKNLANNNFELSLETYYKVMDNQIDYRDGADILNTDQIETQLLYGVGRAYGLEMLLRKKTGKLNGWLSYTLAKTEKKINGINQNQWYNARQDRTHEIAIVANYSISKKWTFNATWVYYTGNAVTFPEGKYYLNGQTYFYYTSRNAYRMPAYHRLDLGATLQLKKKKNFSSELVLGLYNAYGRKNAYAITFKKAKNDPNRTEIVRTTLFKMLPSISYNFKF